MTLPGDPPIGVGHLHLVSQIRRRMEDVCIGLGFSVVEGPEIEYEYYNFTALNRPSTPPSCRRTPSTWPTRCCCAPTPRRCRCGRWRCRSRRSTSWCPGRVYRPDTADATHVPMFHQLEGLAIDEDITLADLQGTLLAFARQMFGEHTEVRLRRATSRSPSRAWRWTCPASAVAAPASRDAALPHLQGRGLDRDPRLGDGRPERARLRARSGYDKERVQGFAFGMGIERIAMLVYEVRTCACCSTTTCACSTSSSRRMRVPFAWLRSYCDPGLGAARSPTA